MVVLTVLLLITGGFTVHAQQFEPFNEVRRNNTSSNSKKCHYIVESLFFFYTCTKCVFSTVLVLEKNRLVLLIKDNWAILRRLSEKPLGSIYVVLDFFHCSIRSHWTHSSTMNSTRSVQSLLLQLKGQRRLPYPSLPRQPYLQSNRLMPSIISSNKPTARLRSSLFFSRW